MLVEPGMDIRIFPPHELLAVLPTLRAVASENHRFSEAERALLEGVARLHGLDDIDLDALEPVPFDEVARVVVDPHRRKRAVQLAMVTALVEGSPSEETEGKVRAFATSLGIDEPGLAVLSEIARGQLLFARVDMIRRVGTFIRGSKDFPGIFGMALPILGLGGDDALADRYRALQGCAPGTLGRAIFDHFADNGFKLPGEPGGIPMIFHDLGHVIAGYGTDPQGEIQQAAFQAGFARRDGFSFLLFGILQFHLGMRITPVAKGYTGLFDVPRVLRALERGAGCKVDLAEEFDVFANKDRPLEQVRAELGVAPR